MKTQALQPNPLRCYLAEFYLTQLLAQYASARFEIYLFEGKFSTAAALHKIQLC